VRIEPVLGGSRTRHGQHRGRNAGWAHRAAPARPRLCHPGRRLLRPPRGRPAPTRAAPEL